MCSLIISYIAANIVCSYIAICAYLYVANCIYTIATYFKGIKFYGLSKFFHQRNSCSCIDCIVITRKKLKFSSTDFVCKDDSI